MDREITIDDVIAFIVKNCDNTEYMDKINRTSFPFTAKYLSKNKVFLEQWALSRNQDRDGEDK